MKSELSDLHPDLQPVAGKIPEITYSRRNLWFFSLLMRLRPASPAPADLSVENILIPRQQEQTKLRLRIYTPRSVRTPAAALLWMHGGGYVMGRPEQDDGFCARYARELGIVVVSVDYRCAPKYPFPAGLEDCYSALKWVTSNSQQAGINASRIAIGGASAGGGLAASLAQLAHDRQEVQPVFQLLVYPMLDDRTVLRTDIDDSRNVTWNRKSNQFGWESYLGRKCGAEEALAYSVPARRSDLSGLPPAWIGVGTLDLFYEEDLAYARRLQESGVPCELDTVPGAFHGFDVFDPSVSIVQKFWAAQISALKKYLTFSEIS